VYEVASKGGRGERSFENYTIYFRRKTCWRKINNNKEAEKGRTAKPKLNQSCPLSKKMERKTTPLSDCQKKRTPASAKRNKKGIKAKRKKKRRRKTSALRREGRRKRIARRSGQDDERNFGEKKDAGGKKDVRDQLVRKGREKNTSRQKKTAERSKEKLHLRIPIKEEKKKKGRRTEGAIRKRAGIKKRGGDRKLGERVGSGSAFYEENHDIIGTEKTQVKTRRRKKNTALDQCNRSRKKCHLQKEERSNDLTNDAGREKESTARRKLGERGRRGRRRLIQQLYSKSGEGLISE